MFSNDNRGRTEVGQGQATVRGVIVACSNHPLSPMSDTGQTARLSTQAAL